MSVVVVELVKAGPPLTTLFVEHLVKAGVSQPDSGVSRVKVDSFEDSVALSEVIAAFVAANPGTYELLADGPGATIYLHRLHAPDDAIAIADILATCAGLK